MNEVMYFGFHIRKKSTENEKINYWLVSSVYNKSGLLFFGIKNNPQNFTGKNYNHFMVSSIVPQFFSTGYSYVKVHRQ
jgi:hypothetical protein